MKLRENFSYLQKRFGANDHPPPWQTFVIKPEYGQGNIHFVQKVFEGPFEVYMCLPWAGNAVLVG